MSRRTTRPSPVPSAAAIPAFFLYGEPLRAPDERTVHVETIAARSRLHDWKIRAHRHRDLQQVLILWRGTVDAQLDGAHTMLSGPALLVVPPGAVHSFKFARNTDGLVVTFAPDLAREVLRASGDLADSLDRPIAIHVTRQQLASTDARSLAATLLREFGRAALGRECSLRGLLGALLTQVARLTRGSDAPLPTPAHRARELIGRFRQLIEGRYREHLTIAAYASSLGCSEGVLRKACAAVLAQSPVEVVHARLVIEAERQLRYTGLSITQIAYFLGFEDPAYFSRFFTHRAGVAPRRFRSGATH